MRTLKIYLTIGFPGAMHRDEIEVEDDATEEQIEEEVRDWAMNHVEWGWTEVR